MPPARLSYGDNISRLFYTAPFRLCANRLDFRIQNTLLASAYQNDVVCTKFIG